MPNAKPILIAATISLCSAGVAESRLLKVDIVPDQRAFLGLFDTRDMFGHFEPARSKIVLRIDDDIQIVQRLDGSAFKGLPVEIGEGDHKFAVQADVVMRNVDVPHFIMNDEMREYPLKAACSSIVHVAGSGAFRPIIVLDTPTQAVQSFQISKCELSPS